MRTAARCHVRRFLTLLLTLATLSFATAARASHETIVIDGDLTDLITAVNNNIGADKGGFAAPDALGDTYTMVCGYTNGFDIINAYVLLDFKDAMGNATPNDVTLYVGWDMDGIVGDVDGNGNPNTFDLGSPGGSTGCALADEPGIGPNESYNLLLDLDCAGAPDDIRIQVKDNTVTRVVNGMPSVIPGATFMASGDKLELKVPNYQNLLTGTMITADLCDARMRLTANAAFDGPGEDFSSPLTLLIPPSIDVTKNPPTRTVCAGSPVSWAITVTNNGLCRIHALNVEDVLGAGMTFDNSDPIATSVMGQTIRWEFANLELDPGESMQIDLTATTAAPCASGTLTNNVSVEAVHLTPCLPAGTPPPTANDSASATVTCRDVPPCDITGDPHTCFPSSETYTANVGAGYNFSWSFNSVPPGICSTSDPLDGSSVTVDFTGAGVCTVSLTVTDPENPEGCNTTCNYIVTSEAQPPCNIDGVDEICALNNSVFTTNVGGTYSKAWSVSSVPAGIASISGASDGDQVTVNFSGPGTATLQLRVGNPADPVDCVSMCEHPVTVNQCVEEPDLCWMTGGGCLDEPVKKSHKNHSFGGNIGPPPDGSWEHIVREKNKIQFNFHSWDAHVDSCWVDGLDGPCSPHGEINNIAWSGTGKFSVGNGVREEDATFKAHVADHGEPGSHDGHCGSEDFYEITVYHLDGSTAFHAEGYLSCGNLQLHPFHGNQGPGPVDWRALINEPADVIDLLVTRPFPNPVRSGAVSIEYRIPTGTQANVRVTLFDVSGRVVRTLEPGQQASGGHSVDWDLRDEDGSEVPNGIYFYRLTVGTESVTEKLMVVRQ
ncbi:MAG TPA: FlgD immunoglobulin-like domain containing protein [Candidatus Eisenbacteria bacterium]